MLPLSPSKLAFRLLPKCQPALPWPRPPPWVPLWEFRPHSGALSQRKAQPGIVKGQTWHSNFSWHSAIQVNSSVDPSEMMKLSWEHHNPREQGCKKIGFHLLEFGLSFPKSLSQTKVHLILWLKYTGHSSEISEAKYFYYWVIVVVEIRSHEKKREKRRNWGLVFQIEILFDVLFYNRAISVPASPRSQYLLPKESFHYCYLRF